MRVLVHRPRAGGLLCLADRQRDRDGAADGARLELPGGEGAHGQLVQGPDRDGRRRDGSRLLVLRHQRGLDDLPLATRTGAQAPMAPLEVFRHGRRRPDRRNGAGRDPGAARERGLALQGRQRGRLDRPDQPRSHQPRHGVDDARGGRLLRARALGRRSRAVASPRRHLLLRAPRGLAGLLFHGALPRLPRGSARRTRRTHARAGRRGDADPPVPDHGGRDRDVRRVLAAARDARALGLGCGRAAETLRGRGVRGLSRRHAAGPRPGVSARERSARPRWRRGRRDRQPARPAEHARRTDAAPDGAVARRPGEPRRAVAIPQGAADGGRRFRSG